MGQTSPTVGAVIIGDEILSEKVKDTNSPRLIRALRRRGGSLRRLSVVGDRLDEIGREVRSRAA
ncbi:MAG: hypothetical protein CSA24_02405 [Deltaproteobacteria bacterium]|nr:MAG: hypothetical protein CSA24_02405 [Deltaproteobacteria bacterium]